MDQIYISKKRYGLEVGSYVAITSVLKKPTIKSYYYHIKKLEPIKVQVINDLFNFLSNAENVIIAGSFLEKGFNANDIDIIIINGVNSQTEKFIMEKFGMVAHVIEISYDALKKGVNTDPLFQMLLSKFVAKKRILFKIEQKINYKLLDLHLLKSKILLDNFDYLSGKEKYNMLRNVFAIKRFLELKELSKEYIDLEIANYFGKNSIKEVNDNIVEKKSFINKYRILYDGLFNKIMEGIKNESEQK